MERIITVKELIVLLQKQVEQGNGDLPVVCMGSEWELPIYGEIEVDTNSTWDSYLPDKYLLLS